ncbi:Short-chain dehydrogenase/reductase SDR [Penicillium capsulatum]|uniref:Short-chain dehydrogenase/reductase SDR n=1 Tax=Penicillium capsulatum TaxID=69766 RepID=A0A9W9IB54_9EURO|nr:Short-chain dehydrogenase/reductase SDR [Penicillium capsulatum]KAJ6136078.1 Short-chain dehydrogenase/reductase SDR [Penicillium capsulatum]
MAFPVNGKSAVITGAGSGINLAWAKLLVENGCNVLIADLALRPEAQVFADAHAPGYPRVVFQPTNVTQWNDLERMFDVAEREFGEIDIVCPGAGILEAVRPDSFWSPASSEDVKFDQYTVLDVNLVHPIRTTQMAISRFLRANENAKRRPKHIILISSIAGQSNWLVSSLYVASKHGISGFVRSLAKLDDQLGIRVTAVAPGIIKTPLWTDRAESAYVVNEKKDVWVTPQEVASAMLALVQQDQVSVVGDQSDAIKQVPVHGGTILEVSKTVRAVAVVNDPGPADRPGTTASGFHLVEEQIWGGLSQKGWGLAQS